MDDGEKVPMRPCDLFLMSHKRVANERVCMTTNIYVSEENNRMTVVSGQCKVWTLESVRKE